MKEWIPVYGTLFRDGSTKYDPVNATCVWVVVVVVVPPADIFE